MQRKQKGKIVIDIAMTLVLFFVSGYQFWGEAAHEWAGAGMFGLFIAHHLLNLSWHKNLLRGKYGAFRIFMLMIDTGVLIVMLMQMYSGIVLSRYVFDFLPIESGLSLARKLHILGAYWGFLLMSLHIGLHWSMVLGMLRKATKIRNHSKLCRAVCIAVSAGIAVYGIGVFIKRDFMTYLLLQSEFVFLDYSEPAVLFYLDYFALMGLCIFTAHYAGKLCRKLSRERWRRITKRYNRRKELQGLLIAALLAGGIMIEKQVMADCSTENGKVSQESEAKLAQQTHVMIYTYGNETYMAEGALEVLQDKKPGSETILELQGSMKKIDDENAGQSVIEGMETAEGEPTALTIYMEDKIYGFYSHYKLAGGTGTYEDPIIYYGYLEAYSDGENDYSA